MNRYTIGGALALVIAAAGAAGSFVSYRSGQDSARVQGAQEPGAILSTNPNVAAGVSLPQAPGVAGVQVNPLAVSPGGTASLTQVPMCFTRVGCVEVQANATGAVTSTATVVPGQWYEVTTVGDKSGEMAGCWDETGAIAPGTVCGIACGANDAGCSGDAGCVLDASTNCKGFPKLKDGSIRPLAFVPSPVPDAGSWSCPLDAASCTFVKQDAGQWYCPPGQTACGADDAGCQPSGPVQYACGIECGANDAGCSADAACALVDSGMQGCTFVPDKDAGTRYCETRPDTGISGCAWQPTDAGPRTTVLNFFALTSSGISVTLCPEIPCQ